MGLCVVEIAGSDFLVVVHIGTGGIATVAVRKDRQSESLAFVSKALATSDMGIR